MKDRHCSNFDVFPASMSNISCRRESRPREARAEDSSIYIYIYIYIYTRIYTYIYRERERVRDVASQSLWEHHSL